MKEFLKQYKKKGEFTFRTSESLSENCNAPKNAGGIYIVIAVKENSIIYIGSSGWVCQNGDFKIRKNGMYDRIVNGKQFEKPRKESWKVKMEEDKIKEIKTEWYITFDENVKHIPAYAEAYCIQKYFEEYKCLPKWNTDF